MSCSGSSTGKGAGWPTRRALSGGISHTSRVRAMNSSVMRVLSDGRPSARRCLTDRARSKRPLLATTTRSVMSRRTGFAAPRNDPHAPGAAGALALLPDELAPEQQAEPVLEDADDVGREAAVRLAPEVGDVDGDAAARLERPHALGEHVLQQLEVLEVRG